MGKAQKIRRYQRKDYSSVVEFPVEIIGRDGVVRRYSFEESIRLYERRIASADLRYSDRELIGAEKQHCQARIDQLRRSFFAHYGWPAVEIVDEAGGAPGVLAAEVAAFLRRCLTTVDPQPERFSFSLLESAADHRVYYVQPPPPDGAEDGVVDGHFLLYVFAFDAAGTTPVWESFFDLVKVLDGVRITGAQSVESLVAFFHTHDCGLILTGSGAVAREAAVREVEHPSEEFSWAADPEADPVETGMRLLSRGRFEDAMQQFTNAYSQQHFRRVAYLGAAVVADQLGLDSEMETATVMGGRYFPGDPAMEFHRAVHLMRIQQFEQARATLSGIDEWPNGGHVVGFMDALCLLADKHLWAGRRRLGAVDVEAFGSDPHLATAVGWVRAQQLARDIVLCLFALMALAGVGGLLIGSLWWSAVPAVAGVVLCRLVVLSWHRQLIRQLSGKADQRMRLCSSAILADQAAEPALR
jgi:hypothetical protein